MADLSWPWEGLALPWAILFSIGLAVIVGMFLWTAVLFARGARAKARAPRPPDDGADRFHWVFMVPAMNEQVTIRDSVERLLSLPLAERLVLVIDDGSTDRTGEILDSIDHPDLFVLERKPPHAQLGKAAALNHAYHALEGLRGEVDRERVIVCIIDADGRLHPDAPRFAAAHFQEARVGGVQNLVRIYNRRHLLTYMQDVEFGVYGHLFQAGRNAWGTAGMGGNGQFNRLSALDDVVEGDGPWRDRLTEDQDLGLRLIEAGWVGRQELRGVVDQQGLSSPRALFRQRTRWSQGNLQAVGLAFDLWWAAPVTLLPRFELLAYLLMPFWQGIVGASLLGAAFLALTGEAPLWAGGPTLQLLFFYMLAFGGTILGCIASRMSKGMRGWIAGIALGHLYAIYTWSIWPVLIRSIVRMLTERSDWSKTEREPLADAAACGGEAPARRGSLALASRFLRRPARGSLPSRQHHARDRDQQDGRDPRHRKGG